jgi:hypothetical protein
VKAIGLCERLRLRWPSRAIVRRRCGGYGESDNASDQRGSRHPDDRFEHFVPLRISWARTVNARMGWTFHRRKVKRDIESETLLFDLSISGNEYHRLPMEL